MTGTHRHRSQQTSPVGGSATTPHSQPTYGASQPARQLSSSPPPLCLREANVTHHEGRGTTTTGLSAYNPLVCLANMRRSTSRTAAAAAAAANLQQQYHLSRSHQTLANTRLWTHRRCETLADMQVAARGNPLPAYPNGWARVPVIQHPCQHHSTTIP